MRRRYHAVMLKKREKEKNQRYLNLHNTFDGGISFNFPNPNKGAEEKDKKQEPLQGMDAIDLTDLITTKGGPKHYTSLGVEEEILAGTNIRYPLTPAKPKQNERVFAWGNIRWDAHANCLSYIVHEPAISNVDEANLKKIKKIIEEKLNVHFEAVYKHDAIIYLKNMLNEIISEFEFSASPEVLAVYEYYVLRDFIGLGKLQPLMNDGNIEDISCDGVGIPVFIYHRNPHYGSLKTNIIFDTKEELDDFVIKLSQRCEKSLSIAEPLLDGALTDGSRVHATLGSDVARRGSNYTIRKFTEEPLTPIHMLRFGTLDEKMLAYLWFVIENNASILVSGPTAAGKTSLLNALSLFIHPSQKIVSIEDTPELRLPHPHWVPEVSRSGFGVTGSGKRIGEVSMFDLLKGSLRQRPDYIIVGEVRGEEAYVLFQQMATGHAGFSTIHADSVEKVIDRLTTKPINLPASLLETLDIIVFANRLKYKNRYVRRAGEIQEILNYDVSGKKLKTRRVFKWVSSNDTFASDENSQLLRKISEKTGMDSSQIKQEIKNRMFVLKWMYNKNMTNYKDVGNIISRYYTNKESFLEQLKEEED